MSRPIAFGQVVGGSSAGSGPRHAVLWARGSITDLGTLPGGNQSEAHAINSRGQIVGLSYDGSGRGLAVLWDKTRP